MAAAKISEKPAEGFVRCTVTRKGAGQISTGERRMNDENTHTVDVTYDMGETFDAPEAAAARHEDRAYVMVLAD